MNQSVIIVVLIISCIILLAITAYQHFIYKNEVINHIVQINDKLRGIMDNNSDEKIMVFTDQRNIISLASQINGLLQERQKMKADFIKSEQASKRMLSNISHDIKTPLTVILGYLEIMRIKGYDDKMVENVERKANQVIELINQFFSLAKLEAGDTDMEIKKINISEVCREVILDFYQLLKNNEIVVEIEIPQKDLYVCGNDDAIRRILTNIISNAIHYGSEGKYLGLLIKQENGSIFVHITDKGKGIEKEHFYHIFERLYTHEDSRNYKIQGNGLGLTIAKSLVNSLGGEILVESVPNEKTTFTVKFIEFQSGIYN